MESDDSPWNKDPHVLKTNSTGKSALEYLSTITDYFSIPLCVAAISADILLITIMLKYRRLKTRTNFYLVNFAIFHMLYIVSTPLFYIILDIFYKGWMEVHWYCVWIRVENFAMGLAITFIGGFGIDSFLEKIRPSWFTKYKQRYPYVFSFFYFGHSLIYLTAASICIKKGFTNNFNFYFLSAYFFIILISVLYITYKEEEMEKNLRLSTPYKVYALTVSVIILLMWLPLIVFYNLMIIFRNVEVEFILWHTAFLPEYLVYCCSLVIIYTLWKSDKQFKTAFRLIFRRTVLDSDVNELNVNDNEERIRKPL